MDKWVGQSMISVIPINIAIWEFKNKFNSVF